MAGNAAAVPTGTAMSVATGGTLDLNGFDRSLGSLGGGGTVTNGGAAAVLLTTGTDNADAAFDGVIQDGVDAVTLTKTGTGRLELGGVNTYTGATSIAAGTLVVNGSIASSASLTANSETQLGGNGFLPSTTINGGTLAPGNSIGLITVNGNLVFGAGSTYAVEVSPSTADRTNVTGTATLTGGTVAAYYQPGTYAVKSYTILNAAGGRGGTKFAGLTTNVTLPGLDSNLVYDATNVFLVLTSNLTPEPPEPPVGPDDPGVCRHRSEPAGRHRQRAWLFRCHRGLPAEFTTLNANSLSQVTGEPAAGAIIAGIDSADQFMRALEAQSSQGGSAGANGATPAAYAGEPAPKDGRFAVLDTSAAHNADPVSAVFASRWKVWGSVYGGSQQTDGDAGVGSHSTDDDTFGLIGGIMRQWGDTRMGLALGGGSSNFDVEGLGSGDADSFDAGLSARQGFGNAYLAGVFAYGFHNTDTSRAVPGDILEAEFNAQTYSGRVEGGYRFATPVVGITPYAAFQAIAYHLPGYVRDQRRLWRVRAELRQRHHHGHPHRAGRQFRQGHRARRRHDDLHRPRRLGHQWRYRTHRQPGLPGAAGRRPFRNRRRRARPNALLVDAGASYAASSGFFASLSFDGEFSGNVTSYAGKAKIGITW